MSAPNDPTRRVRPALTTYRATFDGGGSCDLRARSLAGAKRQAAQWAKGRGRGRLRVWTHDGEVVAVSTVGSATRGGGILYTGRQCCACLRAENALWAHHGDRCECGYDYVPAVDVVDVCFDVAQREAQREVTHAAR